MNKQDYIKNLKEFVAEKGISIYDYFYAFATVMRSEGDFIIPEFEMQNPFLTARDIQLLLESKEDRIEEYYARVMTRVIELNEQLLSREEIVEVIDEELDKVDLTRQGIEEVIDESLEKTDDQSLTREGIKEVIDESMEDHQITRTDIVEVVDESLGKSELTREGIVEVIDGALPEEELSRGDIISVIDEELDKKPSLRVIITSISKKIADLLNGFAVIKEEKTGRAHLYYHDAKKDSLSNEKVILNNKLDADSGYYVNFQEYIDEILNDIIENSASPEEIHFVREDGVEKTMKEMFEEAFAIARQAGAIRFGKELVGKDIKSYQDLLDLQLNQQEEFGTESLKVGIYVRRDIITRIFAKYKARVSTYEEPAKKEVTK